MKNLTSYEKALSYIKQNSLQDQIRIKRKENPGPVLTISRETGIGAAIICEMLVNIFNQNAIDYYNDWTYFDKELINKVIEDHQLPEHFKKYLIDESPAKIDSWFGEILGITPSKLTLLNKTKKTIYHLAEFGNVILVGRGANIILANHSKSFHIRLVASLNYRIENAMKLYHLSKKEATDFIMNEDEARRNYILKYFHKDINDNLLYHVTINAEYFEPDEVAKMISNCIMRKFPQFFK
ncbi:MAG: cytidylate kinase-like family protein [Melioribacteraceae bacterium]|nr:cytidylate kinase-like family protein [Melioribacteraceae bacterium]